MKKILTITLLTSSLLLASCWTDYNKASINKQEAHKIEQNKILTWKWSVDTAKTDVTKTDVTKTDVAKKDTTKKTVAKKDIPKVYIAFANDKFKKASKDKPYNIFVKDDSALALWAKKFFKEHRWKKMTINDIKKGTKSERTIYEYAPVQFFDVNTPVFNYKEIVKTNPTIIHTVSTPKWDFFMFNFPFFGKEYIIFDAQKVKEIKDGLMKASIVPNSKKDIIMVEDLLNANTAKDLLSDEFNLISEKNNVSILWIPNISKKNTNALKLLNFVALNSWDKTMNMDLIKAILSKQKDLKGLNMTDWTNIIEILKTSNYKNVDQLKKWDLSKSDKYDYTKAIKLASDDIGVLTVPSIFQIENNKLWVYYPNQK